MKIKIIVSELYPLFEFVDGNDKDFLDYDHTTEIPKDKFNNWKCIMREFEIMQRELNELVEVK